MKNPLENINNKKSFYSSINLKSEKSFNSNCDNDEGGMIKGGENNDCVGTGSFSRRSDI